MTFRRFVLRTNVALVFAARIAILFAPPILIARQRKSLLGCHRFLWIRMIANLTALGVSSGTFASSTCGSSSSSGMSARVRSVHFHIFGRIGFMPFDCVAFHSSDHRLCPSACVPTRRTPICVRESFSPVHEHVCSGTFATTNFKSLWTVCQISDGSLEGCSALRILDPEHA